MDQDVARLKRHLGRHRIITFAVVLFLVFLTVVIIGITQQLHSEQAYTLESQAAANTSATSCDLVEPFTTTNQCSSTTFRTVRWRCTQDPPNMPTREATDGCRTKAQWRRELRNACRHPLQCNTGRTRFDTTGSPSAESSQPSIEDPYGCNEFTGDVDGCTAAQAKGMPCVWFGCRSVCAPLGTQTADVCLK